MYPFIKIKPRSNPVNTGIRDNRFFVELTHEAYYNPNDYLWALEVLHELMHAALVRKDELHLPNLGMHTTHGERVLGVEYWICELSMMVYMKNILNKYPYPKGTIWFAGPFDFYSFLEKAKNHNPDVPEEWWDVTSLEEICLKFKNVFTLEKFENKLTNALNYLMGILKPKFISSQKFDNYYSFFQKTNNYQISRGNALRYQRNIYYPTNKYHRKILR